MIICGFPGVGKTVAGNKSRNVIDVESTRFHWLDGDPLSNSENANWVNDYVDYIEKINNENSSKYILVSCHKSVREELLKRGLFFVIVVPYREILNEYIKRYIKRGDNYDFIKKISDNWYKWLTEIDEMRALFNGAPVVYLDTHEYISDCLSM